MAGVVPRRWLRLPRRTARLRLTLLCSGICLVLGTVVIAIIFVLASGGSTIRVSQTVPARDHAIALPDQAGIVIGPPNLRILPSPKSEVIAQRSADMTRLLEVSWVVLAIAVVLSGLLGWFASGRVLRPLREMTATARTISAGNLGERLALTGPDDEFKQLGDTLDDLLARLEASFEAQRRFVANASHELRTPLTVERTVLQVALADPNADAATLRAACAELLASGREQERLLESLLTLAISERGLDHREPVDLGALAGEVLSTPRPEIERRELRIGRSLAPAPTAGDPALVQRLIANLVDNAVHYNRTAGGVEIRTATDNGHALLSVANTGPVISADQLERLFEPFQRLDGRTGANHGLGLSIVRAIANAHGAQVDATAQPEGGLAITVRFAAAARSPNG